MDSTYVTQYKGGYCKIGKVVLVNMQILLKSYSKDICRIGGGLPSAPFQIPVVTNYGGTYLCNINSNGDIYVYHCPGNLWLTIQGMYFSA